MASVIVSAVSSGVDNAVCPVIIGASFSAVTINTNVSLAVAVPSFTVTVMVVVPFWFAAGVITSVRFVPLPPRMIFAFGTRVVFDDVAVTVRDAAGVSTSPTAKAILPVDISSFVLLSEMSLTVGKSFTAITVRTNISLTKPELASLTVILD